MNSHEAPLYGLYEALLRDCLAMYPQLSKDWERDRSRLLLLFKTRGSSIFTLDLPAFDKHFLKCLENGLLVPSSIPCMGVVRSEYPIPRLFKGLILRVFHKNGSLRSNVDVQAIKLIHQLCTAGKKFKGTCSDARIRQAVYEYFDIERSIRSPDLDWDSDSLVPRSDLSLASFSSSRPGRGTEGEDGGLVATTCEQGDLFGLDEVRPDPELGRYLNICQLVCDEIVGRFDRLEVSTLRTKHGPGAVSDKPVSGSKYEFRNWPQKLDALFPFDEFGLPNSDYVGRALEDSSERFRNHEPPARLIAVPKTMKAPRLIAAEPTSHQWIQQGILRYLVDSVASGALRDCISFKDQSLNGTAALFASSLGSHSTIDLSAASDRVSCRLVERVFRRNSFLLEAMHASRTRWVMNDVHSHLPRYSRLKKFAAMGSALTFPVQSIIFACVAITGCIIASGSGVTGKTIADAAKQIRVFGDDIIVPTHSAGYVIQLLTELGLSVNQSKTFRTGKFRESCGVDAYDGVDVTPTYFTQPYNESKPETIAATVDCANNFHKEGYWYTSQWLQSTLPRRIQKQIPLVSIGLGAFGFLSFVGSKTQHLKRRWNEHLHRFEVKALSLVSKTKTRPTEGSYHLLQWFTENPGPDIVWASGIGDKRKPIARLAWVPETQYSF